MILRNSLYQNVYLNNNPSYHLLPFRFIKLDSQTFCLVNDLGEYYFLNFEQFQDFTQKKIPIDNMIYKELRSKHFAVDDLTQSLLDSYIIKYRAKKSFLDGFTKLHMIVPTLRCNHSCPYCQVSRVSVDKQRYDMTLETARNTVNLIFHTPAKAITVEFQGGEPLLNYPVIEFIVKHMTSENEKFGKLIDFVVATNLSHLTDDMLDFFKKFKVDISTSLDGPEYIHNPNRPKPENDSYQVLVNNLERARNVLGIHRVAALMTTTRASLSYPKEIIDEYVRLRFKSIFLRPLNPYGFAVKTSHKIGYTIEEFFDFYQKAFEYIIDLNRQGIDFQESFAKMILTKILTPFPVGYVDCQSPSGAGVGATLYNYNGNVYPADEARMLAEMGDNKFCMGNVNTNTHSEIFASDVMQSIARVSCNEALAGCSSCAYQPYCGADPINNYATQGHILGQRYSSYRCKKHLLITSYLINFIKRNDPEIMNIFMSWISNGTVKHMEMAH